MVPLLSISQAQLLIVVGPVIEERSVNTVAAPRQTLAAEKFATGEALTSAVIVVSCTQPLLLVTERLTLYVFDRAYEWTGVGKLLVGEPSPKFQV